MSHINCNYVPLFVFYETIEIYSHLKNSKKSEKKKTREMTFGAELKSFDDESLVASSYSDPKGRYK